MHPNQRFSDNIKPFSIREAGFLSADKYSIPILSDQNTIEQSAEELDDNGIIFSL